MMNIKEWKKIPAGTIVASGETTIIQPLLGGKVTYVVKKGHGHDDWAIYFADHKKGVDWCVAHGSKLKDGVAIRELFPCDDEVLNLYRR